MVRPALGGRRTVVLNMEGQPADEVSRTMSRPRFAVEVELGQRKPAHNSTL